MAPARAESSGQNKRAKITSTSVSVPREKAQVPFAFPTEAPRLVSESPSCMIYALFDLVFFYWFPGQVSLCKPFKSEFSFIYISVVSLDIFPVGFQSEVFLSLLSPESLVPLIKVLYF